MHSVTITVVEILKNFYCKRNESSYDTVMFCASLYFTKHTDHNFTWEVISQSYRCTNFGLIWSSKFIIIFTKS